MDESRNGGLSDEDELMNMWSDSATDSDIQMDDEDLHNFEARQNQKKTGRKSAITRRRARPLDPDAVLLTSQAVAEFHQGKIEDAIKYAEEAIRCDAEAIDAFNLLTTIYDELGDPERALIAKIAAAHLNKSSKDDWLDIADRSVALGHLQQAAIFYQQVSRIDPDDWSASLTRADLYFSAGRVNRALSVLERVKAKFFNSAMLSQENKSQILLLMAQCYKSLGKTRDAIELYMDLYHSSFDTDELNLNWQDLNVLAELLVESKMYQRAIRVIKSGARIILGRGQELWWADRVDDAEFDDRRSAILIEQGGDLRDIDNNTRYTLPIDIRWWLLLCRLQQYGTSATADEDISHHLQFIENENLAEIPDILAHAAQGCFAAGLVKDALRLYNLLSQLDAETEMDRLDVLTKIGECHKKLGDTKSAERVFKSVTAQNDRHIGALVGLGEIYQATERPALARMIIQKVYDLRASEAKNQVHDPLLEEGHSIQDDSNAALLFKEKRAINGRLTTAEKVEAERNEQQKVDQLLASLKQYEQGLNDNLVAALEWIRVSMELIQIFAGHKQFFPSDRNKVYGDSKTAKRLHNDSIDDRLHQLQQHEDESALSDSETQVDLASGFREQPFDFWFELFMRCALFRARLESISGALAIVRLARSSNIFITDPQKLATITKVELACGVLSDSRAALSDTIRHMYMNQRFDLEALQLYAALNGSGAKAMAVFASSNNQKFILRQIKALDESQENLKLAKNPILHLLYASMMLMGPSYVPALTYLFRALETLPNHPLLLLTVGVVYIQRAIQRVSTNRHLQILQGLSFMDLYVKARCDSDMHKQEAEYNMGRLYHGLGLFTYAEKHYLKVFEYHEGASPDFDLSREAAYNLHLIYAMSGNMALSQEVVAKYLVI